MNNKSDTNYKNVKSKLKTAKGRKISSTRWLNRQLNDIYVNKAKSQGYVSRAAYKLIEIDEKFNIFNNAEVVVDLGAAPGSWTQIVIERCKKLKKIVAVDLLEMSNLVNYPDLITITGSFQDVEVVEQLKNKLDDTLVDVVISDLAPNTIGHKQTDHLRIIALVEDALYFAITNLKPGGNFIAKFLMGGAQGELQSTLKNNFHTVKFFKPKSSRRESNEMYIIALGFKEAL